jgi:hypothetical protein
MFCIVTHDSMKLQNKDSVVHHCHPPREKISLSPFILFRCRWQKLDASIIRLRRCIRIIICRYLNIFFGHYRSHIWATTAIICLVLYIWQWVLILLRGLSQWDGVALDYDVGIKLCMHLRLYRRMACKEVLLGLSNHLDYICFLLLYRILLWNSLRLYW